MSNTEVILSHSSINATNDIKVYCNNVTVSHNKNNDYQANANYSPNPVNVQSVSIDNVKYTLKNVKLGVGDMSYDVLRQLIVLSNDTSNPLILKVKFGNKKTIVTHGLVTSGSNSINVENAFAFNVGDKIGIYDLSEGYYEDTIESVSLISSSITVSDNFSESGYIRISKPNGSYLLDSTLSTTEIPVTVDDTTNINIDTSDSSDGYMPVFNLTLVETKVV